MLGARPNVTAQEHGIDGDTEFVDVEEEETDSTASASAPQTPIPEPQTPTSASGTPSSSRTTTPQPTNPVVQIKRRKKESGARELINFLKVSEDREAKRHEEFVAATKSMISTSTQAMLTGMREIFGQLNAPPPPPPMYPSPPMDNYHVPTQYTELLPPTTYPATQQPDDSNANPRLFNL